MEKMNRLRDQSCSGRRRMVEVEQSYCHVALLAIALLMVLLPGEVYALMETDVPPPRPIGSNTQRRDPVKVLVLGDSMSTCSGLKSDFSFGYLSYRQPLWKMLKKKKPHHPTSVPLKGQSHIDAAPRAAGGLDEDGVATTSPQQLDDAKFESSLTLSECVEFVGTKEGCNKRLEKKMPVALDMPQVHDAIFGRTAKSVSLKASKLAEQTKPDVIMMLIGINDFFLEGATTEEVLGYYRTILTAFWIENPKVTVLLGTLLPSDTTHKKMKRMKLAMETAQGSRLQLNKLLKGYDGQLPNGAHSYLNFKLVDLAQGFDAKVMTYDGLHPNYAGEEHLAKMFFAPLRSELESKGLTCYTAGGRPTTAEPTDAPPTPLPTIEEESPVEPARPRPVLTTDPPTNLQGEEIHKESRSVAGNFMFPILIIAGSVCTVAFRIWKVQRPSSRRATI